MKMAAMSQLSEEDAKLASQCLDICQTLAGKSLSFSFSFNIGPNFSFSVDTREKEALAPNKRKKTPSTLRRDARRRKDFLQKKINTPTAEQASQAQDPHPSRPLHLLPSPPPASGRRRVMSCVGRLDVPTFSNLDGAPLSSPPPLPLQLKTPVSTPPTPPPFSPPPPSKPTEPCPSPLPPRTPLTPGDASKFLHAPYLYQCTALLPRAQPCERIFAIEEDLKEHCRSVHGCCHFNFYEILNFDIHNCLYIL